MLQKMITIVLGCWLVYGGVNAQTNPKVSFFHVTPSDFQIDLSQVDTTDGAVLISDFGNCHFETDGSEGLDRLFTRKIRLKILNKKGFDAATFKIRLFKSGEGSEMETLSKLNASTYLLENGKVVETVLDKEAIFTEKEGKGSVMKTFTMPAVKEGAIIDVSYTITNDFSIGIPTWYFQGQYPRLWTEYEVNVPEFFIFNTIRNGFIPFTVDTFYNEKTEYRLRGNNAGFTVNSNNIFHRWVAQAVPVLKAEKFTTSLGNYISKINFQLVATNINNNYRSIQSTWGKVSSDLMRSGDFGFPLTEPNTWMDELLNELTKGSDNRVKDLEKIYTYVRDHFRSKGSSGIFMSQTLREVFKSKEGSNSDINLLLVAMLLHLHLDAQPVILSTRNNGYTDIGFPIISQYNHVIARVKLADEVYFLDASIPYNAFNKLPSYCYNGHARIIDQIPMPVYFQPDSIKDAHLTTVVLVNDEKDKNKMTGTLTTRFGFFESYDVRRIVTEKGEESFFKEVSDEYTGDFATSNLQLDYLKEYEKSVELSHGLAVNMGDDNPLIYFSPMLKEGVRENDFKSTKRLYPVEMDSRKDDIYLFQMEIPKGYVVEELPKSARVMLNDDDGVFEYIVESTSTDINIRSRIKLNKATFPPEDYETLHNFYDLIVKKHAEQIVFKKQGS